MSTNNSKLAAHLAAAVFRTGNEAAGKKVDRIAFMHRVLPDEREITHVGLAEVSLANVLELALDAQPVEEGPVCVSVELVTGGKDPELDAIGICSKVLKDLPAEIDGKDVKVRVIEYLLERFG